MISSVLIISIFYLLIPKTNTPFDYLILSYMLIPFSILVKECSKLSHKALFLAKVFLLYFVLSGLTEALLIQLSLTVSVMVESIIDLVLLSLAVSPFKIKDSVFIAYTFVSDFLKDILSSVRNKKMNLLNINEIDRLGQGSGEVSDGKDFELYIAQVFRKGNFKAFTTDELKAKKDMPKSILKRGGSGEQGCDNIIWFKKKTKIHGELYDGYLVQAKHYSGNVPNSAAFEAYGAIPMYSNHFKKKLYPIVVTNREMTGPGKDLAESQKTLLVERHNIEQFFLEGAKGKLLKIW